MELRFSKLARNINIVAFITNYAIFLPVILFVGSSVFAEGTLLFLNFWKTKSNLKKKTKITVTKLNIHVVNTILTSTCIIYTIMVSEFRERIEEKKKREKIQTFIHYYWLLLLFQFEIYFENSLKMKLKTHSGWIESNCLDTISAGHCNVDLDYIDCNMRNNTNWWNEWNLESFN